mgnify:CR=1 FL=1
MGILTNLRDYFGVPETEQRAARTDILPPSRTDSSSPSVQMAEALSLAMVYRAINILASAKQMSLHVYKDEEKMPSPAFIRQPDVSISRSAFIEQTIVALATNGNAYWRITRDAQGRVQNLKCLNPLDMIIVTDTEGNIQGFNYGDKRYRPDEIQHLMLMRVPGSVYGLGAIQAAQRELRGALDTRDYSSKWFSNSGVPNGVLKSDQILSPDQAQAAKEAWNASAGAKNGVAILGNGLNYTPVYLSPADAQFLEVQNFNVTQVARLFGVPSSLMLAPVEGTSLTYQNVEQDWIGFVRFSLAPSYLVEIEDAFSMLLPGRNQVKFNIDSLLRSDTLTRYQAHKIAIEAGFMTAAEVRNLEDLPNIGSTPNV